MARNGDLKNKPIAEPEDDFEDYGIVIPAEKGTPKHDVRALDKYIKDNNIELIDGYIIPEEVAEKIIIG